MKIINAVCPKKRSLINSSSPHVRGAIFLHYFLVSCRNTAIRFRASISSSIEVA